MKISVVIVNYNGQAYIKECVDSVLKSVGPSFEIVLVENGSTDGSLKLLKREYGANKRVRVVESKENLFFAGGSNLGAKKSKGEWLVFLNSDTVVDKNWLKELWKVAKANKKLMLQPKILIHKTNAIDCVIGRYVWPGFGVAVGRGEKDEGQYKGLVKGDYANGTCLMVNKDWFLKLGGFDEWFKFFYEDLDLQLRTKKMGGKAVGVMKSVIEHKGSLSFKQNVASDEVVFHYRRNRLVTVLKNYKGIERWVRWVCLVMVSFGQKRLKMSLKAMLMSLDWLVGQYYVKQRLRELRRVAKKRTFSMLDLGCGDGKLVKVANEWGIKAIGIDQKDGMEIEKYKPSKKFEVISLYHVLEHTKKPVGVLKRVKKWLKKDGVLVIEVPLVGNLTEKWLGKDYLAYWDKTHKQFWTKDEVYQLVEKAGFKVIKKGRVWQQVFFHVVTASLGRGWLRVMVSSVLWLPLKLLSAVGKNDEMLRFYVD